MTNRSFAADHNEGKRRGESGIFPKRSVSCRGSEACQSGTLGHRRGSHRTNAPSPRLSDARPQCGNGTASLVLFEGSRCREKTITPAMMKKRTTASTMNTFTFEVRFLRSTGGVGSFLSRPIRS